MSLPHLQPNGTAGCSDSQLFQDAAFQDAAFQDATRQDAVGDGRARKRLDTSELGANEAFWPRVYDELRWVAKRQMRSGAVTLQATALVHEAYMRLADDPNVRSRGRAYFFAAAAQSMRRIAIDHARARSRDKRGGGLAPVTLETWDAEVDGLADDVLDLHRALEALEKLSPRQAGVVECRYFGGLDIQETAEALGTSARTVKRDWTLARAWLYRHLARAEADTPGADVARKDA